MAWATKAVDCSFCAPPTPSSFVISSFWQVRRSLFGNDSDRRRFLMLIMSGVCDILRAKEGLSSLECYQNFCRLLGRLKANYQLSELVRTEGYEEWLKLAAEFAVHSFSQMHVRGGAHYCVLPANHCVCVPYSKGTFPR
jgi:exportin-7